MDCGVVRACYRAPSDGFSAMRQSETSFLRDMARKYRWDELDDAIAAATPDQTRRLMDLGVWDDLVTLEQVFGRYCLAVILKASGAGSMREILVVLALPPRFGGRRP